MLIISYGKAKLIKDFLIKDLNHIFKY